jgi:exonuclease III
VNKLEQEELQSMFSQNDLVFLTETWSSDLTDLNYNGFTVYSLHRLDKLKGSKRSSGGICCYVKNCISEYVQLYLCDSDDILWLKISKSLLNMDNDLFVCLCYVIPQGSSREHFIEDSVYDRILLHMVQISNETNDNCSFLLLGDLNSRVGHLSDFVPFDFTDPNVNVLPDDYISDIELPRKSQDSHVNQYGRYLIDFCRESQLRIMNGRVGKDAEIGKFTYVDKLGSSLIDYVICSQSLINMFSSFDVDDPNILSDHCAVNFSL